MHRPSLFRQRRRSFVRACLLLAAFGTCAVPDRGRAAEILGEEHVVEMSDGVRLYATVGRPDGQAGADAIPTPGAIEILRGPLHPSSVLLPVIPSGCDGSVEAFAFVTHPGPCAASLADALSPSS